ncbi:hypothetical protein BGZ94_001147 [Podila epigama]|nr:hypothetical protein BGZ94_001147 [Podila epigama]
MIVRLLKFDRFEPERIVTSNWVGPKVLAAIRFAETIYVWTVIISIWITSTSASSYLKYFTNLTFFGLSVYFLCTSIWTIGYLRQPTSERAQWIHRTGSGWLGYLHWLLYSTIITYHIIVPVVFWTLLSTGNPTTAISRWQNYSVHLLDGVLAISELIFNRHFLQPIHSLIIAGIMLFYMFLTFIVHKTEGTWVYPFLDWNQGPKAAIYYIGICIGLFVVFFVLLFVHKYRNQWLQNRAAKVNPELALQHQQASSTTTSHEHTDDLEAGFSEKHDA